MGFLRKLFKKSKNTTLHKAIDGLGGESQYHHIVASYNPSLIDDLLDDHKDLFAEYARLAKIINLSKTWSHELKDAIIDFHRDLNGHILIENQQLYTYLSDKSADKESREYVAELKQHMKDIVKDFAYFSRKYADRDYCNKNFENMKKDIEEIGRVLTRRVKTEEKRLFKMYIEN